MLLGTCLSLLSEGKVNVLEKLNEKFNGLFNDCSIKVDYEQTSYGRASLVTFRSETNCSLEYQTLTEIITIVSDDGAGQNLGKLPDVIASLQEAELRLSDYTTKFEFEKAELGEIACILLSLDLLNIETISCSPLPMGEGSVLIGGVLHPIPLPSTLHLMVGMKVCPGPLGSNKESVTRNICALLRALTMQNGVQNKRPLLSTLDEVSVGTDNEKRVGRLIIENHKNKPGPKSSMSNNLPYYIDTLNHLEANLDDCTGEMLSFGIEMLMNNGAIDAWVTPIVMKKGRAAHTLHCLCHSSSEITERLLLVMFEQSTTLGIRIHKDIARVALHRSFLSVETPYIGKERQGKVDVKVGYIGRKVVSMKPEFDHCKAIHLETGVSIKKVSDSAIQEATRILEDDDTTVGNMDEE